MQNESFSDQILFRSIQEDNLSSFLNQVRQIKGCYNYRIEQEDNENVIRSLIKYKSMNILSHLFKLEMMTPIKWRDDEHRNLIHYALEEGSCLIVKEIFKYEVEFNRDLNGNNELHKWVLSHWMCGNCLELIASYSKTHSEYLTSRNKNKNNPLHLAVIDGNTTSCKMLIKYFPFDLNENGEEDNTLLHFCARHNNLVK